MSAPAAAPRAAAPAGSARRAGSGAPPPGLVGAALLFWGWENGVLAFAVPMALLIEGARLAPWRWELSDRDFNRVADLSGVLFLLMVIYLFDVHSFRGIYAVLRWLPFVLYLSLLSQVYSTREATRLSALFLSVRRAEARRQLVGGGSLDLSWPYAVACLLSASAGQHQGPWFFPVLFLFAGWALWGVRPPRYALAGWMLLLAAAAGVGFACQAALVGLRASIEPLVLEWFQDRLWRSRDPYRAQTAIGYIGRLKSSDRIVLRVRPDSPAPFPRLLREASYQSFSRNVWLAGNTTFTDVRPNDEGVLWALHRPDPAGARSMTISTYLHRGKGLLAMPTGTFEVNELLATELQQNPLGAVKVREGPELAEYGVRYAPRASFDLPPTRADLTVPSEYRSLLASRVKRLGLAALPPEEAMARLAAWFRDNFHYSLVQGRRAFATPVRYFLEESRSGHCEYFATATVLLLRAAGIPARYATGYSVQEYSPLEGQYLVRRRHAHSWALAWAGGRWRDFDTTPPVWSTEEAARAPWWEPVYDLWSWAFYRYTRWRLADSEEQLDRWLLWALGPLLALLGWRLYARRRVRRAPPAGPQAVPGVPGPGLDSEFYGIEARLRASGLERARGETPAQWLRRHGAGGRVAGLPELLGRVLPAHYRYRFDPAGITPSERAELRAGARHWLARHGGDARQHVSRRREPR